MGGNTDDKHRRPLPRWRYSKGGLLTADYQGDPRARRESALDRASLDHAAHEFADDPSVSTALELVHASVAFNDKQIGRAAAKYLERHSRRLPAELAAILAWLLPDPQQRDITIQPSLMTDDVTSVEASQVVRTARARLIEDPRNALYWLDVARAYTVLGNSGKAEGAMQRAIALAPNHRAVLRANARWLFHRNEADRAWSNIKKHPRTQDDPWLMAVEVALAQVIRQPSVYARAGRKMLEALAHEPAFVTELASAIGTLELNSGSTKRGRKLLRLSLVAPTDNAVAQAEWIARSTGALSSIQSTLDRPGNMEGRFWRAWRESRWKDALSEAVAWQEDEPYSSRPAINGSFVALALEADAQHAITIARTGLRADPKNQLLRNNYAVALVYAGEIDSAIRAFGEMAPPLQSHYPFFTYLATFGLLHLVTGRVEAGRAYFDRAAMEAPAADKPAVAVARLEAESLIGVRHAEKLLPLLTPALQAAKDNAMMEELVCRALDRHRRRVVAARERPSERILVFPSGEIVPVDSAVLKTLGALTRLPRSLS